MVCRLSGRKISRSLRLVMRMVFVGVTGCVSGGRLERSSFSEAREDVLDDSREGVDVVGDVDMLDRGDLVCGKLRNADMLVQSRNWGASRRWR